ncbi:MAG: 1,6-anhydro-N-acetylmuramyl-L-alanine amidase AmpD, partial [Methyloglobulus sp.]|nr:1,6-anhydro-N-acetylmuramyl-L-alanine amidase AmpD [Methyloglobulus sp.]
MHIDQHWLSEASQVFSANLDDRPDPDDISLLVIHCISLPPGEFGNACIDQLFCNR